MVKKLSEKVKLIKSIMKISAFSFFVPILINVSNIYYIGIIYERSKDMSEINLYSVPIGRRVIVEKVLASGGIKRRLLDIGLTPGTMVESVLCNPGGNLIAYMIRGALIAIRDDDAKNVLVRELI